MKQTDEFRRFVKEHAGDDLTRLLLSASRYPSIDVPFAVDQIASRRQLFLNLPPGQLLPFGLVEPIARTKGRNQPQTDDRPFQTRASEFT